MVFTKVPEKVVFIARKGPKVKKPAKIAKIANRSIKKPFARKFCFSNIVEPMQVQLFTKFGNDSLINN